MRKKPQCRTERTKEAQRHYHHLREFGPCGRHNAAHGCAQHCQGSHDQDRDAIGPAQDNAQHDGERVERNAYRQSALDEKNDARECACLCIETLFEIFVCGVNLGAMEQRHQRKRKNDHGERQPEVELHEAHAIDIRLARRGDERDGARLRRHD